MKVHLYEKEVDYIKYFKENKLKLISQKVNEDGGVSEIPFKVTKIVPGNESKDELFLKWNESRPNILTVTKENNSSSVMTNYVSIEEVENGSTMWFEVALLNKNE